MKSLIEVKNSYNELKKMGIPEDLIPPNLSETQYADLCLCLENSKSQIIQAWQDAALSGVGFNIAHAAALAGRVEILEWIKVNKIELLSEETDGGLTIPNQIAQSGNTEALDWLKAYNIDLLRKKNKFGENIICFAVKSKNARGALIWLRKEVAELFYEKSKYEDTLAHYATLSEDPTEALDWISVHHTHMILSVNSHGQNIAHYAAKNKNSRGLIWIHENAPKLLSTCDYESKNIAFYAAQSGSVVNLAWIKINISATLRFKNSFGVTTVLGAATSKTTQSLDWIKTNIPDILDSNDSLLNLWTMASEAALMGCFENLDWFFKQKNAATIYLYSSDVAIKTVSLALQQNKNLESLTFISKSNVHKMSQDQIKQLFSGLHDNCSLVEFKFIVGLMGNNDEHPQNMILVEQILERNKNIQSNYLKTLKENCQLDFKLLYELKTKFLTPTHNHTPKQLEAEFQFYINHCKKGEFYVLQLHSYLRAVLDGDISDELSVYYAEHLFSSFFEDLVKYQIILWLLREHLNDPSIKNIVNSCVQRINGVKDRVMLSDATQVHFVHQQQLVSIAHTMEGFDGGELDAGQLVNVQGIRDQLGTTKDSQVIIVDEKCSFARYEVEFIKPDIESLTHSLLLIYFKDAVYDARYHFKESKKKVATGFFTPDDLEDKLKAAKEFNDSVDACEELTEMMYLLSELLEDEDGFAAFVLDKLNTVLDPYAEMKGLNLDEMRTTVRNKIEGIVESLGGDVELFSTEGFGFMSHEVS